LSVRAPLLAWGLLTAVAGTLQLRAAVAPPPAHAFNGFFFFWRDGYYYLSYAQQAQDGAVLFRNKAVAFDHAPALVNLEWMVSGWMAAGLGGRPVLAFMLLGHAATLALLLATQRWIVAIGVAEAARLPALLLVAFGGGLGGVRWLGSGTGGLDMTGGLYPFMQALSNPHHATATALLAWSLLLLAQERPRATAAGLALGTVLGLSRPFDLVLLGASRALVVVATHPPREAWRRLLPLTALAPTAAYNVWVFGRSAGFRTYTNTNVYQLPPYLELAWALGPGLLLALVALAVLPPPDSTDEARRQRRHLLAWVLVAGLLVATRPVSFAGQFAAGLGVPILLLGSLALGRFGRGLQAVLVLTFSTTALALTSYTWTSKPVWHVPAERLAVARALRPYCRTDDRALAPPDIGLYLNALSACRAYVSHEVSPGFDERITETLAFYQTWDPGERRRFLDRTGIRFVLLPGNAGPAAEAWLGVQAPFTARAWAATPAGMFTIYERQ
jgi:hypothetical protein